MKKGESPLNVNQFEVVLLKFINTELLAGSNLTIDADSALFKDGLVDSLKILQLLAFIESVIDRVIPDEEIVMKHFGTVRVIAERYAGLDRADEI